MTSDRYALPLTTSAAAAACFDAGVDRLLAGTGDPLEPLDEALGIDPGFALGWAARARACMLSVDPSGAADALAAAQACAERSPQSARERSGIEITALLVHQRVDAALESIRSHVARWPRDALMLAPATGVFGLIGFSGRVDRESEQVALLEPLVAEYGDDWWFRTAWAFALIEADAAEQGTAVAQAALAGRPDSAHAAHTYVHGLYELGEHARALAWLQAWAPAYAPNDLLYCHVWWHVALFQLHAGDVDAMWATYDGHCLPEQSRSLPINVFTDGVALAWRALAAGHDVPRARWEQLHAYARANFPRATIFLDVHQAACLAALGDDTGLQALQSDLEQALERGRLRAGPVVLALAEGFRQWARGDRQQAAGTFSAALPDVVRIGGSRAQRRLVNETLAACGA